MTSDAFQAVDLVPARDSLGLVVPRRWSNLEILFDGSEVDSWRIDSRRIGFRVPLTYSGAYGIAYRLGRDRSTGVSARVVGRTPGYAPMWVCAFGAYPNPLVFLSVAPEEVLAIVHCAWASRGWVGTIRLLPGTTLGDVPLLPFPRSGRFDDPWEEPADWKDVWVDELWFDVDLEHGGLRSMWSVGPSFRPGHAVAERYPVFGADSSATWVWRFGRDPQPIAALDCLPPDFGWGISSSFTAAELAPGVCLAVTGPGHGLWGEGTVYLRGTESVGTIPLRRWPSSTSLTVSTNGIAAFEGVDLDEERQWPVFGPPGRLYTVVDYTQINSVTFTPGGDSMYVAAVEAESDEWVLDLRDSEEGTLLSREPLGPNANPRLAASSAGLWVGRSVNVDDTWQFRVELRDPADLSLRRAVGMPCYPSDGWRDFCNRLAFDPSGGGGTSYTVVPDGTGRRAYLILLNWSHSPIAAYAVDMF